MAVDLRSERILGRACVQRPDATRSGHEVRAAGDGREDCQNMKLTSNVKVFLVGSGVGAVLRVFNCW